MMMTLLLFIAMTPTQFQTVILAWLGALTIIAGAVTAFIPKIAPIFEQIRTLLHRQDRLGEKQETQQKQIVDIAKSTPTTPIVVLPPANSQPTPVEVKNEEPIKVEEANHDT